MNVNGITKTGAGTQAFQLKMNQGTDSVSKNIQNQISNAQKQMQELGDNKEMTMEEKMKKRQEIQQQINDLQNQLRQHQIEQRKENQQKTGSSMNDMIGGSKQAPRKARGGNGMSSASMQAIISADSSMKQVKVQGAMKSELDGRAGVLNAEIKVDQARGGDVTKKKEELAKVEAKAEDITQSQMNTLSDANKKLEEAAEADQEAARTDKSDKKDKTDNKEKQAGVVSGQESGSDTIHETGQRYDPIDVVSEGVTVSTVTVTKSAGNNVDLKV